MDFAQIIFQSLQKVAAEIFGVLPNLLGAIILLLIGWLIAKIVSKLIGKLLDRIGLDKFAEKLNSTEALKGSSFKIKPAKILTKFVYWLLMLVFILSATETLQLAAVSQQISQLIAYMPRLLSAVIIFGIGFYASSMVQEGIASTCRSLGIPGWRVISGAVFWFILVNIGVIALSQAGVETTIINTNLSIIIGGVLLAFALAYGFAARGVLSSILTSFYSRSTFEVGQVIELDQHKGEIVRIDNVSFTLDTGKTHVVFPLHRLMSDTIIIHRGAPHSLRHDIGNESNEG